MRNLKLKIKMKLAHSSSSGQKLRDQKLVTLVHWLLLIVERKDSYTFSHTKRVAKYCAGIVNAMCLPKREAEKIKLAAMFYDVGKLELGGEILNKKTPLTEGEWTEMQKHTLLGEEIAGIFPGTEEIIPLIRHHHERFDGKGYPDRLVGEAIPLGARIIAVADSFDAMISDRPYRKKKYISQALTELQNHAGTQWDPEIVEIFMGIAGKLLKKQDLGG